VTLADDVTEMLVECRGVLADAFHGDWYEVVRVERREVEGHGWDEQPGRVVERGRCAMLTDGERGGERIDEQVIAGLSPHVAELPIDTVAVAGDAIRINGRTYVVEEIRRGGHHRLFARARLQERWSGG
jgi:hypothetical protein